MSSSATSQGVPSPDDQDRRAAISATHDGVVDTTGPVDVPLTSTVVMDTAMPAAAGIATAPVPGAAASSPSLIGGRMRDIWRLLTLNPKVMFGLLVVLFFVLLALFGPIFVTTDPNAFSTDILMPPSPQHLLGTTQTGQDVFAQVIKGARTSVFWGFLTGIIVTMISITIGLVAGYFGGFVDELLSLLINVFLVLPALPLAIVFASYLPQKGPGTVALVIVLTSWAWGARVLRGQTMSMRQRDFVEAARASGERTWRIIFFEILPNEIAIVASGFVGTVVFVILAEAALEFLGLGDVNVVSWGTMFYWAQNNDALLLGAWWWFVAPGVCIALLGAALAFVNYGIDEMANPRLRREPKPKAVKVKKAVA